MVSTYIYADLRREKLIWLTREDGDLKSGPSSMLRIRAKSTDGRFWEPKSKKNRVAPISRTLRSHLDHYQQGIAPGHCFFPSSSEKQWDADNVGRAIRKANKATRLPWSCADYRHTFGSHLAMKGESLYKIATLMGNSPEICRRHYAALIPESLSEAVDFDISVAGLSY